MVALATIAVVGLMTWLVAHRVARRHGKTLLGLHGLELLAAPASMLAAVIAGIVAYSFALTAHPIVALILQGLTLASVFWLAWRMVDVAWTNGRANARVRRLPAVGVGLHGLRHIARGTLMVTFAAVVAVRLGAADKLYLVLGGVAAAITFAARDPIRNAVAFASMVIDPAFQIGDRVRIVSYRGGEEAVGEVTDVSLFATTLRTRQHTVVVVANVRFSELRVENLSAADRRRLELVLPIPATLTNDAIVSACDAIERDLRDNEYASSQRPPRVWLTGLGDGLQLKASVWLHRASDRREAQRALLLAMHARLH
jgi:small-conductance mechanosensitive channel